jgi:hypothetical protein
MHFEACEYWRKFWAPEGLKFPFECEDNEEFCDQYNPMTLPPAYIGLEVWLPWVYISKKEGIHIVHLDGGKVSGLQQKVNGSWKIRVSNQRRGSVADYTVEEFNEYCFLNKEDAEKYIEEKVKEFDHGN